MGIAALQTWHLSTCRHYLIAVGKGQSGAHAAVALYTAEVYPVHESDLGWLHRHKLQLSIERPCRGP